MVKEILCTLGPASMNDRVIARLEELGVALFRLNLSHTKLEDVAGIIQFIRSRTTVPLCLDTEGAQIRSGNLVDGEIVVRENGTVRAHRLPVPGDSQNFNFHPESIIDELEVGDFIRIDSSVLVQVIDIETGSLVMRVLNGGKIGQNKAVTVERNIYMPPLTQKDQKALNIGREMGIVHVALSFANCAADVEEIRRIAGKDAFVISKIESRAGLMNLSEITVKSDALLIDRGDLSRQVAVEQIPAIQKRIIQDGKKAGVKVFVATNLMESMVTAPNPTRAEVNDVFNTLMDGADGLVLAAETAIGNFPIGCASMIMRIIREFENGPKRGAATYLSSPISLLVEPHGGRLVTREAGASDLEDLCRLKSIRVKDTDLMDCEQIAFGTYSPLTGFMGRDALESVLNAYRLPNGIPWTMPIVLQVTKETIADIAEGERIALTDATDTVHAIMDVGEIYPFDFEVTSKTWFGTNSTNHPGVAKLAANGDIFVAGDITLVERTQSSQRQYELTPAQTRFIFTNKGWHKVVGFHTRNVPHRAHEHIQLDALEAAHADGLFLSPVIGPKKSGDFLPAPIIKSYQMMIDFGIYPKGKVVLGCFSTYARYCGPREAVFTAICRKNMGCSHFIVGRDHTGVGKFYQNKDIRELFDMLGDIGVKPIFYDEIGYNPHDLSYGSLSKNDTIPISGSSVREALRENQELGEWIIRGMIQNMLHAEIAAGRAIFCE
ncbi:MAG: pyruvate kinase [Verrucomicrobia bacterium]|nr:pyruvate kinase [Verrucomicrobiota bacterium]